MGTALILALSAFFAGPGAIAQDPAPSAPTVGIPSPNGRFAAKLAKAPGQEAVADSLARWILTVREVASGDELWSTHYPNDGTPARYFTADDGSTFVRLSEAYSDSRTVVRMDRWGEMSVERPGREFNLERNDVVRTNTGATWLTEADDRMEWGWARSEHGPALTLALESSRGWRRELDVSMGRVVQEFEYPEPHVMPGFPDQTGPAGALVVPYVDKVTVPPTSLASLPVRIEVIGTHATPNWKFFAFDMAWEDERSIVLTPYSRPPSASGIQAQVLDGFRAEAYLQGMLPGSYRVAVAGKKGAMQYRPLEVLPGRIHLRLETTGGIAGIRDLTEVFKPGVVQTQRSHIRTEEGQLPPRHLSPDENQQLKRLAASLPERQSDARSAKSTHGSDFMQYRLGWWTGADWIELTVDDGTIEGPVKDMVNFLRGL